MSDAITDVLGSDHAAGDMFGTGSLAPAKYEPFSFTAKRLVLAALAEKAISVVPTRDVMPALRNFLVSVAPGKLQMAASDLELSVLASTPAVTTEATQTLVLPAKRLLDIIKEAPGDDVQIDVAGETAKVRSGMATWELVLSDASEYPALPDPAQVQMHPVSREAFLGALKRVRHAVGRDSGRPPLMQVDLSAPDGGGKVKVTASDGIRFCRADLAGWPFAARIPGGALGSLVKTLESSELDQVHVGETDSVLVFRVGASVYMAQKMMAKFPDVDKLLLAPALQNKLELTADRAELAAAIRRVRINADPDTSAIGLQLTDGKLAVLARDKYGNQAEETVDAGWTGPERLVVVNHQFLTDLLSVWSSPSCQFFLGPEAGKKRSVLLARDDKSGMTGVIYQMMASLVGYGES